MVNLLTAATGRPEKRKSVCRVAAVLEAAGLNARSVEMPAETRTAGQAAAAVVCALDEIVKSILFAGATTGRCVLFLTAGGNRVAPDRAAALAGELLVRAEPAVLRAATGSAIGGVAPLGHRAPLPCFIDPWLMDFATVWATAGTPRHVFEIAPPDLLRLTGGTVAGFADPKM